jgi:hypothetical protein
MCHTDQGRHWKSSVLDLRHEPTRIIGECLLRMFPQQIQMILNAMLKLAR